MCTLLENELVSHIIEDGEILYRFADPKAFPEGQISIPSVVFGDPDLSCDWKKHQKNPEASFHVKNGKTILISVEICNGIRNPTNPKRTGEMVLDWHQTIIHKPVNSQDDPINGENLAHSVIRGRKKMPVLEELSKNSTWISL